MISGSFQNNNTYKLFIFTNPYARAGYDTSLTGLNSEFSFSLTSCLTKAEKLSLPYYLPIVGERIIGFIPFPRVLMLWEMQSVSSRIWSRVTVSITPRAPPNYSFINHIYLIYTDKQDLALNNQQGFICRKTKPTNPTNQGVIVLYAEVTEMHTVRIGLFADLM